MLKKGVPMILKGIYSFNDGLTIIERDFQAELQEVMEIIRSVDAKARKNKISAEKTMQGRVLYSPRSLNKAFRMEFNSRGWRKHREWCEYPTQYYIEGYDPSPSIRGAFREMDFVKNRVGVEVQFGKYAFMVYNVAAKMTIFHNLGVIDVGIEIVPLKELADQMSTGVSYFEQFVWDLEQRGVANIDIPVLVLGILP